MTTPDKKNGNSITIQANSIHHPHSNWRKYPPDADDDDDDDNEDNDEDADDDDDDYDDDDDSLGYKIAFFASYDLAFDRRCRSGLIEFGLEK